MITDGHSKEFLGGDHILGWDTAETEIGDLYALLARSLSLTL